MKNKILEYYNYFKDGIKTMFKEFFKKETNKKQRANMWTFARLFCTIPTIVIGSIAISQASLPLMCVSATIAGFGGFTDLMDGKSARKHKSASEFGKKLDQLVDKLFAMPLLIFLAIINPAFISTLVGESAISVVNLYYLKKYNITSESSLIGKIKQFPLFIGMGVGLFNTVIPKLSNINLLINCTTNMCQSIALVNYAHKCNKKATEILHQQQVKQNNIQIFDQELSKQKTKSIENQKNNNSQTNTLSKQELKNSLIQEKNNLLNQKYDVLTESKQKQYKNEN